MTNDVISAPALSMIENEILMQLATNTSRSSVADSLGIPVQAVAQLLAKKGVKEYLAELKMARKEQMLTYATEVVAATLRDKMDIIDKDEDKRLGNSTKKDHIEIAKTLQDMLKGTSASEDAAKDPMAIIYQKINVIQQRDAEAIDVPVVTDVIPRSIDD